MLFAIGFPLFPLAQACTHGTRDDESLSFPFSPRPLQGPAYYFFFSTAQR